MNLRTDMADERKAYIKEKTEGIECELTQENGVKISRIRVADERGEKAIGKPIGIYITLDVKPFGENGELLDGEAQVFSEELKGLLPDEGTVLVAGLGNEQITPDALGPKTASLLLATRHISGEAAKSLGIHPLRSTAAIIPGVLGRTGIETAEIIDAVVKKINPSAVIAVDALASCRTERLGTTVQISDTGICPGSGVGNARAKLDKTTLGVPVIAVGVPTVVDAATLARDVLESGHEPDSQKQQNNGNMMVTPREIDLVIERAARYIALGINCALQKNMKPQEILAAMG